MSINYSFICIFDYKPIKMYMKQLALTVILLTISLKGFAPGYISGYMEEGRIITDPFLVLWDHVKYVETRDSAMINHFEKAYGKGQITPVKLKEFNKENGKHYTLRDCMNESISLEIFLWHCEKYYTFEYAAKRWNGSGPMTITYWNKVQTLPLLKYRLKIMDLCQPIRLKPLNTDVDLSSWLL